MSVLDAVPAEGTETDEVFVVPASFAQQRLWFLEHLSPGLASYNVPLALRIRGPLDADRLERALNGLVDRHEVLRSALGQEEDEAVQLISPALEIPLRRIEASEAEALRQAAEEARQPFDLSRFPLLRATLWRLAPDDHLLLVVFHHAVTDDWSHGIFLRELFAFYGGQTELPDLAIQYGDFAAWQREWLTGETLELKLMPWRRRLEGAPDTLALPTDRPRRKEIDAAAGMIPVSLPPPLFAALQETARAHGATTFMVLLASLQALLARHSGQSDLLVGCPVANRNRLETEDLIGFFTNTLVLRGDLRDDPTFGAFLTRVREVAVEAFANEDLPFEKLVEDLSPARRLDQNPLFQVMFAFHRAELPSAPLPGLSVEPAEVYAGAAKVDLNLNLGEGPGGVAGIWEYSAALFDRATALRISEGWLTLLADAVARPDRRVSELELLPESERHQMLTEWSWTRPATSRDLLAHQIFERQADQTPGAPAAVWEETSLTYRELESRANQLANHLRKLGLGPDSLVGLCVQRSLDLPVALLGVLKAGAAYVPLDPEYPAERLALMAADAGLAALVTHEALAGKVPLPAGRPVLRLDADRALLEAASGERPDSGAAPANLAYVIYTSGSTGRPKGIALSHRALVNMLDWRLGGMDLTPGSVTLQFSSLSFDASFYEIFSAWGAGGSLALISEEVRRDPVELLRSLDRYGVHRLYLPFIALQMLARAAEPPRHVPPTLREVLSAGEQLQITPQVRGFFTRLPECRLENHYGPSETHVITWLRLGPAADAAQWPAVPGIGRAIEGTWIHLVDRGLRPVPIGVPGELLAGGVGLARGYAGRPDLTAERFVPNPFPGDTVNDDAADHGPGSRLYHTGDLARALPDGSLELLGRIDAQVKIRGVRLEPAEIEAVLAEHPAVAECAVVARRLGVAGMGDLALVAYAAPKPGAAPASRQLREFLAGKLPDAAVPSFFVTVPALPRTPSGKVDRKALPAPGAEVAGEGFVAPRTPTEEVLAGIWQEVLRIDREVGAYDSFFDLGGHSLTAMSVTSQVRPLFHVDLPTRTIFETPVLAHLAERIDRLVHAKEGLELPPLRRMERGAAAPLSFAQQRLWFVDSLAGGRSPFYNVGAPRELRGPLDPAALARAFGEIVRRHEALRTTFRMDAAGAAVQVVHPAAAGPAAGHPLPCVDLSGLPPGRADKAARRLLEENAFQPFDLAAGPLLRTLLVRLGEERHFLGITLHHIVFDGWSIGVLDRELAALYGAFLAGETPRLPELPVQYADYALWQRSWLEAGPTLEKQLDFWRGQLDGAPRLLELPTDRPRPAVQRYEGGSLVRELPEDLARGLEELARHHQVTPFMVLLAAFATLLSRHSGQDDLLVGSPLANRDRAEVEGLIGFFVNLLVLRVDLSGEPTFEQLLARVRDTALHAYAHQDLPFEALVDELQPERNLSTNPLFQAVLSLQDGGQGVGPAAAGLELPGLVSQPFGFDHQQALFDLTLVVRRTRTADGTGLTAILNFKRSLFDRTTLARMLDELQRLLEGAVAAPATPVAALPLWSEAARHQVLREWNDSRADLPREAVADSAGTVDRLAAQTAARTPDALAVTGPDGRLTYAELEERANRLANHLRRRGVRLESRVVLCLDRSVDLVVATVAVLRAGGAYLPVDPTAPEQRLAWMVEDSGAAVVVTLERWAGRLGGAPLVLLDGDAEEIAAEPATAPMSSEGGHGPENLAYVIYTSGSTGRPKGVAVEHRALLDHVVWYRRRYGVTAAKRLGATSSPLFDPTVTEVWTTLTAGATLCVPPSAIVPVAGELLDWLAAERVTHCFLPTVLARAFLEHARPAGLALEVFTTGGDRCPRPPARLPYRFEDWYGPTETTVAATVTVMTPESPPNIGRPVDNAEVFLLDRQQRPVPPGGAGEICIGGMGGAGLSRGYLGRPGLTAERYVPHPFADEPGARLYRSGDRGRFRADGTLEFLGRTDFQVKMRGFRIELGEVESVLGHHPGVRESAVVMRELAPGDFGLAAYYAPHPGDAVPAPSPDELRAWLAESLPDYMVPAAIVRLEALPRTLTGKLDRAALPAPERGTAAAAYVAPRTPTEETLAALWQELLGVERVGAEDHFFLLGGHSLLAVSLAARIRDRFRVGLSMQAVFEEPVLAGLAAAVDRAVASGEPAEESPALVAGARKVRTPRGARE